MNEIKQRIREKANRACTAALEARGIGGKYQSAFGTGRKWAKDRAGKLL